MAKKKRSYAELDHILGRHYRDNSYCGLIAVCLATNASPGKVKRYVEKFAKHWRLRPHGRGTPYEVISLALKRFGKEHDFNWDLFGYTGRTCSQRAGQRIPERHVSCVCQRPCGLYPRGSAGGLDCSEGQQAQGHPC